MGATCWTKQPLMDNPWRSRCIPEAFLVFTRAWHFSLETCRLFREFALKGPLREQMAQRTGKDYQRGKGSSSVVKSFVNSWKKEREIGYHGPWKFYVSFNISPLYALREQEFKSKLNKPRDIYSNETKTKSFEMSEDLNTAERDG